MESPSTKFRLGVDLGGTKIEGLCLGQDGRELARRRVPTPPGPYEKVVTAVRDLVLALEQEVGGRGTVGIGTPGAISPATGRVKGANSVYLNGQPFDRDIAAALERPVRVANDADCFTLSEAVDGAGQGARSVFGVIVGTGTGGGLVYERELIRGCNAIAGEWGHNPLPWPQVLPTGDERPGRPCYCGQLGCIETWLSGPGMAREFAAVTGRTLTAAEIVTAANSGDAAAVAALDRYVDRFARALASIINVFDPTVIVLGGGLSKTPRLYTDVPKAWTKWVFSDRVDTALLPPKHGDASGVRGAAWLWPADAS